MDEIGSFSVVSSGVVYVDRGTSDLVWEGWERRSWVLGPAPWHADIFVSYGGVRAYQGQGLYRDVVGSASGDLVAWIERTGGRRGDLVVVKPSTGAVLARTPVPGPPELPVVLAGIDDDVVHLAIPTGDFGESGHHILGRDGWVWPWADGEPPRSSVRGSLDRIMDVSGEVWAVDKGDTLQFQDAAGRVLSEVPAAYEDRTAPFGRGLSPDGRFWYGPAYHEFVVTATGERVPAPADVDLQYAWTGRTRLTVIGSVLTVCDAATGTCAQPVPIPDQGPSPCGNAFCGYHLPAY